MSFSTDEIYMYRCTQLAKNGLGSTYPNPLVGAVIVYNDIVIGEGWHNIAGENHAEINAILSVKDKELLSQSTLYVSLEPCSHFGKTPPCCNAIIKNKIKKVVIGCEDSNYQVNGNGITRLQEAGIKVEVNILQEKCVELNKRFFTYHIHKRPYVIIKFAQTQDGFIDIERNVDDINKAQSTPISNTYSSQLVHKWRSQEQAIFAGTSTILKDNPQLTNRHWYGNNPFKIILDKDLKIPIQYAIYKQKKVIVFYSINLIPNYKTENITYIPIDFSINIFQQILNELYILNIQSIIVEGGKNIIDQFLTQNLWDEARIITSTQKQFYKGISSPNISSPKIIGKLVENYNILNDTIAIFKNNSNERGQVKFTKKNYSQRA